MAKSRQLTHASLPLAAVVDPVSDGRRLARELKKRGMQVVEVRTLAEYPPSFAWSHEPDLFSEVIGCTEQDDIESVAEQLSGLGVTRALAGCDSAKEKAAHLDFVLGNHENDFDLLRARTNKGLQARAFAAAGIDLVPQQACNTVEEALDFAAAHEFAVWGKPLESAGGDGQFSASTFAQVKEGVQRILQTPNMYGHTNQGVLMMVWVKEAIEEILDVCLLDDLIFVTERAVCRKEARNDFPAVFREVELLPIDQSCNDLVELSLQCHQAVGFRMGYAHEEFFRLKNGRVVPVEINYHRLPGVLPTLTTLCRGIDPATVLVDAHFSSEDFRRRHEQFDGRAPLLKHGRIVCLATDESGALAVEQPTSAIKSLPSYVMHWFHATKPGDPVRVTRDNQSIAGFVRLAHEDATQVELDQAVIRDLEPELFRVY